MAQSAGRFQNAPVLESEPFQGGIHGFDDDWRCVMRIEGGGASGFQFLWREKRFQLLALFLPFFIHRIKNLG